MEPDAGSELPLIRVAGPPRRRGFALGQAAATEVGRSIENYTRIFAHYTGLAWEEVRARAERFMPAVEAYDGEIALELRGIAEGAGVALADILAINARTEIIYGVGADSGHECTTFGALPARVNDGSVLLGMNWDWRAAVRESCILVEIDQAPKPSILMFCEAGLVGKMGLNSAGIGLVGNLLRTDRDRGAPNVPIHVVKRAVLDSQSLAGAIHAVTRADRAASANFMIGSADGAVVNLETVPGGVDDVRVSVPDDGIITHANTFTSSLNGTADRHLPHAPDSPCREQRLRELLAGRETLDAERIMSLLADHDGHPRSICRHALPEDRPEETSVTVASLVMNLSEAELHVAFGPPCQTPYTTMRAPSARVRQPA